MSESEFNTVVIVAFALVVVVSAVGFAYFVKWYKRDTGRRPTPEQLQSRKEELEERFRLTHPDADVAVSGSATSPEDPTGS